MAIYVELPDGSYVEFPDGASDEQINASLQEFSSRPPPQPAIAQEDREGFGAAAAASAARMQGEQALLAAKTGLMSEEEAMRIYNAQKAEADRLFSPTDDMFSWRGLKELAGGSAPYMVAPLVAGKVGAIAGTAVAPGVGTAVGGFGGAFLAGVEQFSASNLARQIDEGKSLEAASGTKALGAAIPMAALDTFALGKIPFVRGILGQAGIKVTDDVAAAVARKGVLNTSLDYVKSAGTTATYEGATEAGQQFFERLQAGLDIADPAARQEYFDSFLGGAMLGGAISPAGRFLERSGAQRDIADEKAASERADLEEQVLAGQQADAERLAQEEAVVAAADIDPEASIDELLREQATLRNSKAKDPVTRARLAALDAAIRPQLASNIEALRAQTTAEQEVALQEQTEQDANDARARDSAFFTAQADAEGNYLSRPAPQVGPTSPAFPMQQGLFAEEDMTGFRTPTFDLPPQSPRPKVVQPKALQRSLGLRGGQTVKPVTAEDIAALGVSNQANSAWLQANVVGKTPGDIRTLIDNNPNLVAGNGELASTLKALAAPAIETAAPTPEGALSLQDLVDTNVPMKTSKGWFEANVVGKTLDDVQALVTADPTLIEGKGQRAKVLREILAPKPPAFEEAPRGLDRPDTGDAPELGPTTGPGVTEPTVLERPPSEPSVGLPDVPAVAEQPGVGELPGAATELTPSEQPGVVNTGLPAGDGTAQPKPSRKRALKPVRADDIETGTELQNWRNTRARVKTPGALVGNAEVEAFLYALDTDNAAGARDALDDIAKVLRSLPKGGNQAARAFVEYMTKRLGDTFVRPLNAAFDRIREIPSASTARPETEEQMRTRRKPVVDKRYLEPVRVTKDNMVVRGSQRLLMPMDDAAAKKYLAERTLGRLDEVVDSAPTRSTPQAGQQELDFTAEQPAPKPVEVKKPEPKSVEVKKPEPKILDLGEAPDLTKNIPKVAPGELSPGSTSTTTIERDGKRTTTSKTAPKKPEPKVAPVQLVKTTSTAWQGNGLGTSSADWAVKGAEHIQVEKVGIFWRAKDTRTGKVLVRRASTRAEAQQQLAEMFAADPTLLEAKKPEPKTVEAKKPEWIKKLEAVDSDMRPVQVTDATALVFRRTTTGDLTIRPVKLRPTPTNPDNVDLLIQPLDDKYTGDMFTAEERVALDKATDTLLAERRDLNDRYPAGKFSATDSNVKATPSMEPYAKFVEGLLKQVGLPDQRIILIASGESRADPLSFGLTPDMEWFDAPISSATQGVHRARRSKTGVSGITINPSVLATGDRQLILEVIAHEFGHMIEYRALESASPEVRAGLQKAHEAWLRQQKGKTAKELVEAIRNRKMAETAIGSMSPGQQEDSVDRPASRELAQYVKYLSSFSEWFADNVSRWATTDKKPVGLIEKFFADLATQLRKLASIVTGKRFMPDRAVAKFMNDMGAMDVASVQSALGGQIENFARNPSIDSLVASSEMAQGQPGPIKRSMELMVDAFSDTAGIDFVDKFRTLTVDAGASMERRLGALFDGAVRSSKGILNPMGLYRQAQDTSKLLLDWFVDGSLVKDSTTGQYNVTEIKGNPSMKQVLEKVDAWGKANGYSFTEAYNTISKILEAKRLDALREENKIRKDKGEKEFGINKLSNRDSRDADAQIDASLAVGEKHKAAIDAIQADMDKIRFGLIDIMVKTGRLSAADGKSWKEATDYIPFDRMTQFDERFRSKKRTGKGISQLGKLPEFIGSENREVGNTFDNFVKTAGWMIEQSLKQDANLTTLKMLEHLGMATRQKNPSMIPDLQRVAAYEKGEQIYYKTQSRWDTLAFRDMSVPMGGLANFFRGFSNVLRTTITSLPPFAVRQVVNDIQRAFATSGVEQPIKIIYPALKNFLVISAYEIVGKRHPSVKEFGRKGVVGDYDFNTRDPMASILYDLGYQARFTSGFFGPAKALLHKLEGITRASDLAVRKAIYDQTMIESKQDALLATTRSREFINFRRRGASDVLAGLSSTIPFFNAYMQGMDVLLRAATGKASSSGLNKNAAKRMFWSKTASMAAMSTIYAIMSSGEDYYDEAGLLVRHNNWILPGGIKLPVPEELAAITKVPAEMLVEYFKRSGTKEQMEASNATFEVLKYAFAQYSPIGGRMTPLPAALKPVLEAWTNFSFFTGRQLEGVYQQSQLLPSQRTRANTSELAKAISKATETILGETNAISPIMIDNTLQGYFGSMAGMVTMFTDQQLNPDRMDRPLQKYWMLSNFLYDPIGTRRLDEFYELRSKTFGAKGTLAKLAAEDPDAAVKFAEDHIPELTLAQAIGSTLAQLSDTRKYKNYLNSSNAAQTMSQEERQTAMEETRKIEQGLVGWLRELQADLNKSK